MSARPHALDLPGRRLVVVDVETNGLHGDVRILSLGLAELRRGIVARSQHWLIDPGNVRMEEGAIAVNGLTPELLEGASSFADNFETIAEWLQPGPTRLTLVAHNAHFDAARLRDEFRRLGEELPSFDLLDTRRLAEATEIPVTSRSLAALLDALGLANTAPHTALADTLAVAEAATQMMKLLTRRSGPMSLAEVIDALCVPYDPERGQRELDDEETSALASFSDAHRSAHLTDISDGRRRGAVLNVCLAEHCVFLPRRMEDGVRSSEQAKQVAAWAITHLEESRLTRADQGRLLRGLGQVLRRTENPKFVAAFYHSRLVPYLTKSRKCATRRQCERCADESGVCDFVGVLRRIVDAFIRDEYDPARPMRRARVDAFLPGYDPAVPRKRGRPPQGFYGELVFQGHLDAAGYGAARVAEHRRVTGSRDWAYSVLAKAWNDGCHTPHLVEMLASMTVVDAVGEVDADGVFDPKAPVRNAISYIDTCLEENAGIFDPVLRQLTKRRDRLEALANAPVRPPRDPSRARNRRPPHRYQLGVAPPLISRSGERTPRTAAGRLSARGAVRG